MTDENFYSLRCENVLALVGDITRAFGFFAALSVAKAKLESQNYEVALEILLPPTQNPLNNSNASVNNQIQTIHSSETLRQSPDSLLVLPDFIVQRNYHLYCL